MAMSFDATQAVDRLRESVEQANRTTSELTRRIETLNRWLLWFTTAIFALTATLVLIGVNILRPLR